MTGEASDAKQLSAEERAAECRRMIEDPKVSTNHAELKKWCDALTEADTRVEQLYARWHELESRAG